VQAEVTRFLSDPDNGRVKEDRVMSDASHESDETVGAVQSYIDLGKSDLLDHSMEENTRMVDIVLSDMSAPWPQTGGFYRNSLSNPYRRMMNTSGIQFRDHAGSIVSIHDSIIL